MSGPVLTPVLTTARFELWQPAPGDLADLFELTHAEETRRYLGGFTPSMPDSFARLLRNAGSWSLYGYGTFMVRVKEEARLIAACGVFQSHRGFGAEVGLDDVPEAGWIIHRDFWGQGVAIEVMAAALEWFDTVHGKRRIAAMIEEGHEASMAVARQLRFVAYGSHPSDEGPMMQLLQRLP